MKKILSLILVLAMCLTLFAGCNTAADDQGNTPSGEGETNAAEPADYNALLAGDYGEITLWVSDTVLDDGTSVVDVTKSQIAAFQELYPDVKFTYIVNPVSEGDAASQVLNDVATAPDIFCFAQDQLTRLVQAAALAPVSSSIAATVTAENSAASVSAASVAGTLYAYPLTADNGFYLYYDTSVFTEEDVEDLATMVEIAEANGGKIRFALANAWYNMSFFFATGCTSAWTMNAEGKWTNVEDTYNSDAGVIAMKGMQILAQSPCYDSDADTFTGCVAIVTGTWASSAAADYFGDNLGATDLPSFTVDGESYHLASYLGCKLMGVKPQSGDNAANKTAVLQLLAQYLTNEENQMARFNAFGWGPSNLNAQANEDVLNNISLAALNKQNEYAVTQGNINGSWWDLGALLGTQAKNATSEEDLKKALQEYDDAIHAILNLSEDELNAWSVIGGICGTSWDTDFPMTEQEDGTFLSDAMELHAGEELKVRQGASWDVNFGDGEGNNFVVEADGTYYVKLTLDGSNGIIELVPAE